MLGDKGVSGGHFGAWVVNFGGPNETLNAPAKLLPWQLHGEDDEQWPGDASPGLSLFFNTKRRHFGLKLGIFTDFQFSPPAFNFFK